MIFKNPSGVGAQLLDLKEAILDFVLPPVCIVCKKHLSPAEKIVCDVCWENLAILPSPFCPACKSFLDKSLSCRGCREKTSLCAARSLGTFDDYFQKLIHGFKYQQKISLGKRLGKTLGEKLKEDKIAEKFDCLVPVPLHSARKRDRGFNQSEVLALEMSEATNLPVLKELLKRTKNTKDQTKLTPEERIENVKGAFALKIPAEIKGKSVILVDDVMTTGATLGECASVLLEAGAERVIGATVAVALI